MGQRWFGSKEFEQLLDIRQVALNNFSEDQLKAGEPISVLRDRLVPLYFLHRYQLEAVVKLVEVKNMIMAKEQTIVA